MLSILYRVAVGSVENLDIWGAVKLSLCYRTSESPLPSGERVGVRGRQSLRFAATGREMVLDDSVGAEYCLTV